MKIEPSKGTRTVRLLFAALLFGVGSALADESVKESAGQQGASLRLAPIVVTPTRIGEPVFEIPASVDVIDEDQIRNGQPQVNASETLVRVPGIVALDRQNYAQDLQISSRGFGARSTFGVRGIRLFVDDMPITSPDGQGQAATIDLSTAERIEVLRGPFSALYGNSSGGVIAVFTEDGPSVPTAKVGAQAGSFGMTKFDTQFGDQAGALNYFVHASRFATDGFRDHSAATRNQLTGKFKYALGDDASLTFIATALHQPDTQDPRGLKRNQVEQDPTQAGDNAILFNTRKSILHNQDGVIYERRLNDGDSLRVLAYGGSRQVTQFLAIPLSAQNAVTSSGGVVDLDRGFYGTDARFVHKTRLIDRPLNLTVGAEYDNQGEHRQGFINDNGIQGALKRDEDDRVYNVDEYAQAEWRFASRWSATLGVRHSAVRFDSIDHFIIPGNGDDSGATTFRATNPVAGLLFHLTPNVNLYANASRGFETPTFAEIAYRPDGTSGLNFDLKPSTSNNYEVGAKAFLTPVTRLNLAVFQIETQDEIVVATSSGGRTTFQNAGQTQRRGAELSVDTSFDGGFSGYAALSYINAEFDEPFISNGTLIPSGNKIPGVPRATAYAELAWHDQSGRFDTALEARWSDKIFVDDRNSDAAGSYAIASWHAGWNQSGPAWTLNEFVRVDNIFDRQYIGAVIVNEANSRFFEPAPGRNYLVGVRASYRF